MKFLIAVAAFAFLLPGILGLTINTPSGVVQCQPTLLTWADGIPPYYLSILPGGQISAAALKTFDPTNGTSLSWTVDIAAGIGITLQLRDSTGTIAYSNIVTTQSSSDSSCLSSSTAGSAASGSSSASGSPTSALTTSATIPATRSSASATSASGIASRTGTSATSAASASATNSASRGVVLKCRLAGIGAGIAGFFGIVAAM